MVNPLVKIEGVDPPSSLAELSPEMLHLQSKYFEEAIVNLITRRTPKEQVRTRPGRGQQTFRYVSVAWFIDQLNRLFGFNWDFEILSHEIIKDSQIWVKGKLTVRTFTNNQWIIITKNQFGSSEVKWQTDKQGNKLKVIDIGDDLKSASSDCLKKCATLLGLAWDVYSGDREAMTEASPKMDQLLTFYKIAEKAGMNQDQANEWFKSQSEINPEGKEATEAVEADILGAIGLLRKLPQK